MVLELWDRMGQAIPMIPGDGPLAFCVCLAYSEALKVFCLEFEYSVLHMSLYWRIDALLLREEVGVKLMQGRSRQTATHQMLVTPGPEQRAPCH
jgi:hypothetical protein